MTKFLGVREYAILKNRSLTSVYQRIRVGRIEGAFVDANGRWQIPVQVEEPKSEKKQ